MVPSTPTIAKRAEEERGKTIGLFQNDKNGDYNMLASGESDASIVMMEDDDKQDKNKKIAINLNKNFDQIMILQQ